MRYRIKKRFRLFVLRNREKIVVGGMLLGVVIAYCLIKHFVS